MIIVPTSSVFILRRDRERGWMTALVWHPRLECWLPAGGHVEANETAAQCGIREALEETGLTVKAGEVLEVFESFDRDSAGRVRYHYVVVDFGCAFVSGELKAGGDATEVRWALPSELISLGVSDAAIKVTRKALSNFKLKT